MHLFYSCSILCSCSVEWNTNMPFLSRRNFPLPHLTQLYFPVLPPGTSPRPYIHFSSSDIKLPYNFNKAFRNLPFFWQLSAMALAILYENVRTFTDYMHFELDRRIRSVVFRDMKFHIVIIWFMILCN
jgi:hypothetical protein